MGWHARATGKRVFVGLSGGVDSAVVAALLQSAGADVTGVFIRGWYPPELPCPWVAQRRDAMRVAARLKIPFLTLDASAEYRRGVIDYLLAEYRAGRTPNPDIMCNREVKFGAFYTYAKTHGADYLATGHYLSGEKDQRYFLWAVLSKALAMTLFPLARFGKPEVRALAKRFDLPVAEKPDSQGVCFLGNVSVKDFLRAELGNNPAILYTLGERMEGGIVVGKDIAAGTLEIATVPRSTRQVGFISENRLGDWSHPLLAQYRYHGPLVAGYVEGKRFVAEMPIPETPAPGQSLVFFRGGKLLGGGIIAG